MVMIILLLMIYNIDITYDDGDDIIMFILLLMTVLIML